MELVDFEEDDYDRDRDYDPRDYDRDYDRDCDYDRDRDEKKRRAVTLGSLSLGELKNFVLPFDSRARARYSLVDHLKTLY